MIEHDQLLSNYKPELIKSRFKGSFYEMNEADYLIICKDSNKEILLDMLKQLELEKHFDEEGELFEKKAITQYIYEEGAAKMVAISIKVPENKINKVAEDHKLKCSITRLSMQSLINVPYIDKY